MSSASSSGWGIASNGGKAPPHPPTARRHVEPPAGVPFQHEGLKKIHNTYFGILGQQFRLSPNLKAQQRKTLSGQQFMSAVSRRLHLSASSRRLLSPQPKVPNPLSVSPIPQPQSSLGHSRFPAISHRPSLPPPVVSLASTQSLQYSLRHPKPLTPILSSTLTVSCHLRLSNHLVPSSGLPSATPCPWWVPASDGVGAGQREAHAATVQHSGVSRERRAARRQAATSRQA
jgi:hypothetical protein